MGKILYPRIGTRQQRSIDQLIKGKKAKKVPKMLTKTPFIILITEMKMVVVELGFRPLLTLSDILLRPVLLLEESRRASAGTGEPGVILFSTAP